MKTFRRLLGFLRPYRRGVIWSFVLAARRDGRRRRDPVPRRRDDRRDPPRRGRQPVAARRSRSSAPGCCGCCFSVARRLVAGRVSLGVEFDLRNRMYAHLQSLELAFFDDQQTGQLMSRSTVDLAGGALLPRLRPDLHRPVADHDRDRRRRDARGEPAAGARRPRADAVRRSGPRRATAGSTGPRRRRCSSGSPS